MCVCESYSFNINNPKCTVHHSWLQLLTHISYLLNVSSPVPALWFIVKDESLIKLWEWRPVLPVRLSHSHTQLYYPNSLSLWFTFFSTAFPFLFISLLCEIGVLTIVLGPLVYKYVLQHSTDWIMAERAREITLLRHSSNGWVTRNTKNAQSSYIPWAGGMEGCMCGYCSVVLSYLQEEPLSEWVNS